MTASPIVLAIDTAAPRLQLALLRADGSADISVDDISKGHAEMIFARIDALLARNGLAYADLGRIAVTTGPGSFTGLRIGLSAAHGLGLALEIPVIGVPTMTAISLLAPKDLPVVVLIDARREEMYREEFYGPGVQLQDGPELLSTADVFSNIGEPRKFLKFVLKFSHVLGSGAAAAANATGATNLELERPEADRGFLDIGLMAQFAATLDPAQWPATPTYIRGPDAKPQEKARIARVSP